MCSQSNGSTADPQQTHSAAVRHSHTISAVTTGIEVGHNWRCWIDLHSPSTSGSLHQVGTHCTSPRLELTSQQPHARYVWPTSLNR